MTLNARLSRLEQMNSPVDPSEHMSIEDIVATFADLDRHIEANVGMPIAEYAEVLEEKLRTGTLADMDEKMARNFIASVRTPRLELAQMNADSFYPGFLRRLGYGVRVS